MTNSTCLKLSFPSNQSNNQSLPLLLHLLVVVKVAEAAKEVEEAKAEGVEAKAVAKEEGTIKTIYLIY
jgi:hypothetical protein